jgi:hypothetical protein
MLWYPAYSAGGEVLRRLQPKSPFAIDSRLNAGHFLGFLSNLRLQIEGHYRNSSGLCLNSLVPGLQLYQRMDLTTRNSSGLCLNSLVLGLQLYQRMDLTTRNSSGLCLNSLVLGLQLY